MSITERFFCCLECHSSEVLLHLPRGSLICPLLPYFVLSSTGLYQRMSSIIGNTAIMYHREERAFTLNSTHTTLGWYVFTHGTPHHPRYLAFKDLYIARRHLTSFEEHVSDDCRTLVDLVWVPTENYSLADDPLGLNSVQCPRPHQNRPLTPTCCSCM